MHGQLNLTYIRMAQEYGKSDILKIVICEYYVSDILIKKIFG